MLSLILMLGCFDLELALQAEPGEPDFLNAEAECWAGLLELEALVDSSPIATNLVVEVTDEEGAVLDTLFPINDLTQADGRVTRWKADMAHDCETPLRLTWTAYTAQETDLTKVTAWPEVPPELVAPDPPWGSDAGGSVVELAGEWLDEVSAVFFGEQAATIVSAEASRLLVETPAHDAGPVDVVVESPGGSTTLDQAFTYYPDQSGLTRGFSRPILFRYDTRWFAIGSPYAQLPAYGPFVQVDLAMIEPTGAEYTFLGAMPSVGNCSWGSSDYTATQPSSYLLMDDGDAYALTLWDSWLYTLVLDSVSPSDWGAAEFDLVFPEGAEDLPAMTLPEALAFPELIAMSADWQQDNPHPRETDLTLSWTADATVDGLSWQVYVVKPGMQVLNNVSCTVDAADGELTIGWETLAGGKDLSAANGLIVQWQFFRDEVSVFPHDNSEFWSRGYSETWTWHSLQ